ncbi:MAG: NAD-binding protein [Planctomycetaceae bacterium]|nr:NAD-binding protein [Planctomycetaceae bacterium]
MTSPFVWTLIIAWMMAVTAYVSYRFRPRLFLRTLRWMEQFTGALIITLGLSVLVCGLFGFAAIEDSTPSQAEWTPAENRSDQQAGDPSVSTQTTGDDRATTNAVSQRSEASQSKRGVLTIGGAFYKTLQIFAFNVDPTELEQSILLRIAMFSAMLMAVIVAEKGIRVLFRSSYEQLVLQFKTKHVVVCGLGRIGYQILADLEYAESQIVVIESDPENQRIAWAREMGAVVVVGDATHGDVLEAAQVHRAREVFVVTGSDQCNIESVIEIRDILRRRGRKSFFGWTLPKLNCHVHILNQDLAGIVRENSTSLEQSTAAPATFPLRRSGPALIEVEVFNAIERTARKLLEDITQAMHAKTNANRTSNDVTEATKSTEPDDDENTNHVLHYFMFGFGDFGQTLALKLAELSQLSANTRNRMSILDTEIGKRRQTFLARHHRFCPQVDPQYSWTFDPDADDWIGKVHRPASAYRLADSARGIEYVCNARFVEYLDVADGEMLQGMLQCTESKSVQPVVLVCFEEERENFARAERLRAKLLAAGKDWPIFVWIPRQRELSQLLLEHNQQPSKVVDRFHGPMDHTRKLSEPTQQSPQAGPPLSVTGHVAASRCRLIPFGQCYGSVSYAELNQSWVDWLARHLHLVWVDRKNHPTIWSARIQDFQTALETLNLFAKSNAAELEDGDPGATTSSGAIPARNFANLLSQPWEKLDEDSRAAWDQCDEWKRASNRSSAAHAVLKVAQLGLRITGYSTKPSTTPTAIVITPELEERLRMMEHYRWVAERLLTGWRFDEDNSEVNRTRWQIAPWSELDQPSASYLAEQKAKGKVVNEKIKDAKIVKLLLAAIHLGLLTVEPLEYRSPMRTI